MKNMKTIVILVLTLLCISLFNYQPASAGICLPSCAEEVNNSGTISGVGGDSLGSNEGSDVSSIQPEGLVELEQPGGGGTSEGDTQEAGLAPDTTPVEIEQPVIEGAGPTAGGGPAAPASPPAAGGLPAGGPPAGG